MLYVLAVVFSVCALYGMEREVVHRVEYQTALEQTTARVSQICSATTDAYEALNKVDLLVIRSQSPDIQLRLLHRLLRASSFASHVETVLKKIKQAFDDTALSTVHNDLILIKTAILGKFSPTMSRFICGRFRGRYDWVSLKTKTLKDFLTPNFDADASSAVLDATSVISASLHLKLEKSFDSPGTASKKIGLYFTLDSKISTREQQTWQTLEGSFQCRNECSPLIIGSDWCRDDGNIYGVPLISYYLKCGKKEHYKAIKLFSETSFTLKISLKLAHNKPLLAIVKTAASHTASEESILYIQQIAVYICDLRQNAALKIFNKEFGPSRNARRLAEIRIKQIKFSHNNQYLFVCSNYGYVLIELKRVIFWDWLEDELYPTDEILSCAFSHNDTLFLVCSTDGYTLYDISSRKKILDTWHGILPPSGIYAFSHDDILLAIVCGSDIQFFDTRKWGEPLFFIKLDEYNVLFDPKEPVTALKFSPDDTKLAAVHGCQLTIFRKASFEEIFFKQAQVSRQAQVNSKKSGAKLDLGRYLLEYPTVTEVLLQKKMSNRAKAALVSFLGVNQSIISCLTVNESALDELLRIEFDPHVRPQLKTLDKIIDCILRNIKRKKQADAQFVRKQAGSSPDKEKVIDVQEAALVSPLSLIQADNQRTYTGLAIDGDGMHALMAAVVLDKLEERTGCRIHELFDCITGSSFGALVALGAVASQDNTHPLLPIKKNNRAFV